MTLLDTLLDEAALGRGDAAGCLFNKLGRLAGAPRVRAPGDPVFFASPFGVVEPVTAG